MLFYVFLVLAIAGSAALTYGLGWYAHAAALWQAPLAALALFLGLTFVFLLFFAIAALLVPMGRQQTRRSAFYGGLLRAFCGLVFPLAGIHLEVTGLEQLPTDGNYLLVCNHLSVFDPVLLIRALPRQARLSFVTKQENFDLPVVRQFMHKLQCLPLNRHDDRQALRAILQAAKQLQEQPLCMTIFPEGQTSKSGQLLPFRNGAFKIAQRAKRPVVVSVLENSRAIYHNLFRRRTRVRVRILGVVPTEDVATLRTVQIGDRAHAMIAAALQADGA